MVPNRVTHHIWILIGIPLLKPWNTKLAALNISTVTIKGLQGVFSDKIFNFSDQLFFRTSAAFLSRWFHLKNPIIVKKSNITGSEIFFEENAKYLIANAIRSSSVK